MRTDEAYDSFHDLCLRFLRPGQLRVETHLLFAVNHDFLFSHIFGFFQSCHTCPLLILIAKYITTSMDSVHYHVHVLLTHEFITCADAERTFAILIWPFFETFSPGGPVFADRSRPPNKAKNKEGMIDFY